MAVAVLLGLVLIPSSIGLISHVVGGVELRFSQLRGAVVQHDVLFRGTP